MNNPHDPYDSYIHNFRELRKALIGGNAGTATLYVYFITNSEHVSNVLLAIFPLPILPLPLFFIGMISAGFIIYADGRFDSLHGRAELAKNKKQAANLIARSRWIGGWVKSARIISASCLIVGAIIAFVVVYITMRVPPPPLH